MLASVTVALRGSQFTSDGKQFEKRLNWLSMVFQPVFDLRAEVEGEEPPKVSGFD